MSDKHFASKENTFVKADANTPDSVDIEATLEITRKKSIGQTAQAAVEVHGDITSSNRSR